MTALLKSIGSYISFGIGVIGVTWGAFVYIDNNKDTNSNQNKNIEKMLSNQDSIFSILKQQSDVQIVLFEGQRGILNKVDRIEQGQKAIAKSQSDYIKEAGKFNPKIMQILENLSPWYLMLEKKNQSSNQYMLTQCE